MIADNGRIIIDPITYEYISDDDIISWYEGNMEDEFCFSKKSLEKCVESMGEFINPLTRMPLPYHICEQLSIPIRIRSSYVDKTVFLTSNTHIGKLVVKVWNSIGAIPIYIKSWILVIGKHDTLYQEYDVTQKRLMEYDMNLPISVLGTNIVIQAIFTHIPDDLSPMVSYTNMNNIGIIL